MFPLFHFLDPVEISLFALVLGRMAGLFSAIPLFGGKMVPARVKVATVFAMALVFFPMVRARLPLLPVVNPLEDMALLSVDQSRRSLHRPLQP